jgi:hypothetical protein
MRGAIVDAVAAEVARESDYALVMGTRLTTGDLAGLPPSETEIRLVMITAPEALTVILDRLEG